MTADERLGTSTAGLTQGDGWRARVVGHSLAEAADQELERGKALVAAASRLIMRSGGEGFSMQSVAAEAGLSMRVLYRLFDGRDDLLIALLEESHTVFARLIQEQADQFAGPIERIGAALYFASDPRQLTDPSYNAAMMRFAVETSLRAADALGRARRPVVDVFTDLVAGALDAQQIRTGNPRSYGRMIDLALAGYLHNAYLRSDRDSQLPTQDEFIRFCLAGLGADTPPGWEERFHLNDEDAATSRARTNELSGAIRQVAPDDHTT